MTMADGILSACRFCLATKNESDVEGPVDDSQHMAVYAEMLKGIFNIEISHRAARTFACRSCVARLADAREFKQMVLDSELRFAEMLQPNETQTELPKTQRSSRSKAKINHVTRKNSKRNSDEELHFEDDIVGGYSSNDMGTFDVKTEETPETSTRRKRKPSDVTSAARTKGEADARNEDWKKLTDRRGNAPILRENSLKLLANSTMCIFQWHKSRYRCFCCNDPFTDMESLREHTNTSHTLKNIEKKIILQQNRLVKVEISSLDCKICGRPLENLASLKQHLVNEHKLDFTLKEDLLVPFKLNSERLQCQICSENFTVFRHLNIHMNRHYQKQVCHICGAGFSNLVYLNLHKTRSHKPLKCNECQIEFFTRSSKRAHDLTVHNVKLERKLRFPCPFCNERYFQEHLRILHLVEKHGMEKPAHSCSICGKVYVTKSLRNNHLKNVHMKQKNRECDVCQLRFYTKSDLSRHKVTHTGEKNFSCASCNNLYATKDSLNRHVKRTHNTSI